MILGASNDLICFKPDYIFIFIPPSLTTVELDQWSVDVLHSVAQTLNKNHKSSEFSASVHVGAGGVLWFFVLFINGGWLI